MTLRTFYKPAPHEYADAAIQADVPRIVTAWGYGIFCATNVPLVGNWFSVTTDGDHRGTAAITFRARELPYALTIRLPITGMPEVFVHVAPRGLH